MRREWLVVAGVLGPFVLLLAAAWWQSSASPARPLVLPERNEPQATDAGVHEREIALEAAMQEDTPPAIEAPVRAVSSEVRACFVDNGAHLHGRQAVTVVFEPTREGGFTGVKIETPITDPRLEACLEDVFAEMRFVGTGRETFEPATHTFIFDAPLQ